MTREAFVLVAVLASLLTAGVAHAEPLLDGRETWVGQATQPGVVEAGAATNDCATTLVISGSESEGYEFRMRTYSPPARAPTACDDDPVQLWPYYYERTHRLDPADGNPRDGFQKAWTVPANCDTGHYDFTIDLGPLGPATPFTYVYEGECNGHSFRHEIAGEVDFVLMAGVPTLGS